jgi:hypothetical protein
MRDNRRQAKIQIGPGRASVAALLSAAANIFAPTPFRAFHPGVLASEIFVP